jgi:hypothetical protein
VVADFTLSTFGKLTHLSMLQPYLTMKTKTSRSIVVLLGLSMTIILVEPARAQITVTDGYTVGEYALSGQTTAQREVKVFGCEQVALGHSFSPIL